MQHFPTANRTRLDSILLQRASKSNFTRRQSDCIEFSAGSTCVQPACVAPYRLSLSAHAFQRAALRVTLLQKGSPYRFFFFFFPSFLSLSLSLFFFFFYLPLSANVSGNAFIVYYISFPTRDTFISIITKGRGKNNWYKRKKRKSRKRINL